MDGLPSEKGTGSDYGNEPTPRQAHLLDWIRAFIDAHGYAPTNREIADAFGWKSTNGVHEYLYALERKGLIERDKRKARALRIVAPKTNAPIPLSLDSEGTGAPEV